MLEELVRDEEDSKKKKP